MDISKEPTRIAKTTQENINMADWNKLKTPPDWAKHGIKGGRLRGMTDINPQWRYAAMTEVYGPCGQGWKSEIKRVWREEVTDGQVFAFAEVNVFVRLKGGDAVWSAPISGIGGSMLVEKETAGLHANDEGYKMAITDALSVALKFLGVGADVYCGMADDGGKSALKIPAPAMEKKKKLGAETDKFTLICKLGAVSNKQGVSAKGPWKRTYSRASDDQYYQTFDTNIGAEMENLAGEEVSIIYKPEKGPKGESRNVLSIEPVLEAREDRDGEAEGEPF